MSSNLSNVFAVFVVARLRKTQFICATTRTDGSIGLPGGKVDPGEDIFSAAQRESFEEGWNLDITREILQVAEVKGKKVVWIRARTRNRPVVPDHKEKHRGIIPIAVLPEMLQKPGFNNEFLMD